MKIEVYGKESSNRHKLIKNIEKALEKENANIDIIVIEDDDAIKQKHVSNTPSLYINDKVISQGKILTEREIIKFIKVLS